MTYRELQAIVAEAPWFQELVDNLEANPPEAMFREIQTWPADRQAAFFADLDQFKAMLRNRKREIDAFLAGQPLLSEN